MQIATNDLRGGMKVEIDREPYTVVSNEFVKPGKGQAFNRLKFKHLLSGRVIEKTCKTTEKMELADILEQKMRLIYLEMDAAAFMDDTSFEQVSVPFSVLGNTTQWLQEQVLYDLIFYKGSVIDLIPPTFMELTVTETAPGVRGDTASGRVMKPAILETGAKLQVPIFINQDEKIKVDTRSGEYVSRV